MSHSLKTTLKKLPWLYKPLQWTVRRFKDLPAIAVYLAERRVHPSGKPIKVGFLCQYIPGWTKVEPVYRLMKEDPRFEPYILCVPSGIKNCRLIQPDSLDNDTYDYFLSHGYPEAINALVGKEQWLDLQAMELSYVFYPRPYNALMPAPYSDRVVSKYSRVCIVMYGMAMDHNISTITMNRDFMSRAYFYFAESNFAVDTNTENHPLPHRFGLRKTLYLGLPVVEMLHKKKEQTSPSWAFSKNSFRVIWTPRWTTALEEGGSNFFTYYQALLDFAESHPDIDFLHRPHPLALSHFLETGEITQQEVDAYQARCEALHNVSLDRQPQYEATFWGSDVLISDISGILPEYLSTGKPLIFCATNMHLDLVPFARRMLEGCYIVNSQEELFHRLLALKNGEDPLLQTRQAVIRELFGDLSDSPSARILEAIASDAK